MLAVFFALQSVAAPVIERTGTFANARISESSGVAVSRTHPGLLWTHNDSGDGPYLYATTLTGQDRGMLRVPRADAVDWEDIAAGPCPTRPGPCLYIADTGDNLERRSSVTVYAVPEPVAPPSGGPDAPVGVTAPPAVLRLRYPDGPHDVEAVFVTLTGDLYLVTKGRRPPVRMLVVRRSAWGMTGVVTARLVQELDLPVARSTVHQVTGAAVSPDGARVAIRSYAEVYWFAWRPDGTLVQTAVCPLGGSEPQGEAVDFLDEETLVLTSEAAGFGPAPVHTVRCPIGQ